MTDATCDVIAGNSSNDEDENVPLIQLAKKDRKAPVKKFRKARKEQKIKVCYLSNWLL